MQAQGDVFGDEPSPPHVLNLFCQWCNRKLKTPWIPFPSMAETRKTYWKSHLIFPSCELRCSTVTWCRQVNAHMPVNVPWVETLPLLCAVLWYPFAHAAKTAKATSYVSEHAELFFCRGVFWGRIFLSLWKYKRNCSTYGAKSILLYALSTSYFLHEVPSDFAIWILACNLYWISQCS